MFTIQKSLKKTNDFSLYDASGPTQLTKGTVYFKPGNKWHIAKEGEFVFGVLQ